MSSEFICLICESDRIKRVLKKNRLTLACCAQCGFIQQYPLPSMEELAKEYLDEDHYMNEILQTEVSYLERDKQELQLLAKQGAKGPLLDVGAGAGALLRAAMDQGWETAGIEISHPSAEHLRANLNVTVHEQPIEQAPLKPESFGVVTFSHSLEHVPDPINSLKHAARALKPGGMVHIAVPNWKALKRRITGLQAPWIYEHHISYFTKKTLNRALKKAGFKPKHWRYGTFVGDDYAFVIAFFRSWKLEGAIKAFLRMGDRPMEELVSDNVQIQCPIWRFKAIHGLARIIIRLWPERLLTRVGRSEELRVTAQKL